VNFEQATLVQVRNAILGREMSAAEATRASLARIDATNPGLFALNQMFPEAALARAAEIDRELSAGRHYGPRLGGDAGGPSGLGGVPLVLKDNICLTAEYGGGRTTCGSKYLENYRSPFTATAAQRLVDSGAVIVGKTNMDEFGMGSSCEFSAFGPSRNPWDAGRVPGGSSGGSAAAVAAGMAPGALGSDTGGSIRQPAGWCNVYGLKPTYGRVSRYGLVAYASSLDQIGPLARTVEDCALLGSVICGHDSHDSTSADLPQADFLVDLDKPVDKLVLGVPRQARLSGNHPAVSAALENAIRVFTGLGAVVVDVDLPHADYGIAAYYIIATAEASSNLARFDGVRYGRRAALGPGDDLMALYARSRAEGFGAEVQRRIMLGTYVLSSGYYDAYYHTALKVRRLIKRDFDDAFEGRATGAHHDGRGCHAIVMPSSPGPAIRLGEKSADPMALYLEDVYTVGVNLAGLPGLTIPAGFARLDDSRDAAKQVEMPVGMQLIGPALEEGTLLRIARMFEGATEFAVRRPG
jgi:aspartyl-tRNA(Asn)/glutamyl-tRNA(Gln) amidotransferase subunit A